MARYSLYREQTQVILGETCGFIFISLPTFYNSKMSSHVGARRADAPAHEDAGNEPGCPGDEQDPQKCPDEPQRG